jgi:hypothetical protein
MRFPHLTAESDQHHCLIRFFLSQSSADIGGVVGPAQFREVQGAWFVKGNWIAVLQEGSGHNGRFGCAGAEAAGVLGGMARGAEDRNVLR